MGEVLGSPWAPLTRPQAQGASRAAVRHPKAWFPGVMGSNVGSLWSMANYVNG